MKKTQDTVLVKDLLDKMTKKEKEKLYEPHRWKLYENGHYIDTLESHKEAKRVMHRMIVEANRDCLDLTYSIERID